MKTPAEDHFKNEIESGKETGKAVVVAGCVPQGQPKADFLKGASVIGVQQIDRVVEVVEETLKGNKLYFEILVNSSKIFLCVVRSFCSFIWHKEIVRQKARRSFVAAPQNPQESID